MKQELCLKNGSAITAPMKRTWLLVLLMPLVAATGCINVKAHIVVDVNVKVDKALDDFFGDLDKKSVTPSETAVKK